MRKPNKHSIKRKKEQLMTQTAKTFNISTKPYDQKIYNKATIEIKNGLTVLVGCNGIGKTTLLNIIKTQLENQNIPVIQYDNYKDGGHNAMSELSFFGKTTDVVQRMCSSEGENIVANADRFSHKLVNFIEENKNKDEMWLLMDAVDSGMSINNIIDIKEQLFYFMCNMDLKATVYIIVSANSYEMANGEQCFDVLRGNYKKFETYDAYKTFILSTQKAKEKRKSPQPPKRPTRHSGPRILKEPSDLFNR